MASDVGPHMTPWDLGLGLGKLVELGKLVISHPASSSHTLPLIPWHSLLSLLQPLSANIFPFMFLFLLFPPLTLWSCAQEKFSSQSIMSYSECQPHVLSQALVSLIPTSGVLCVERWSGAAWEERPQSAQEPWETAHKK